MQEDPEINEYWEKRLSKQFDLSGVGFAGLGRAYNRWLYRIRAGILLEQVRARTSNLHQAHVLDVGSGTGFYVDLWQELGVTSIVGIDITNRAVSNLRVQYSRHEFLRVDIGASIEQIQDRQFDYVSAFDILFHIVDDQKYAQAISNVYSLLAEGGLFFLSENFLHHRRHSSAFQTSRTLETITSYLTEAGFVILERLPMFCLMNTPVDSDSALLKAWWRLLTTIVSQHEVAGRVVGGMLYPFEKYLIRHVSEGPSTEIMICAKLP